MNPLVCVTGDFCSGSTLVFTLFRRTGLYRCLYEPLHEDLREFLVYGLRPDEESHHFFVEPYYTEFKSLKRAGDLFRRRFGVARLSLEPTERDDELLEYLLYILTPPPSDVRPVMFKENRLPFRLAWFRANLPEAKVIHIYRDKSAQWRSIVRRTQADRRRADVGQSRVTFNGFSLHTWCEDLKAKWPELDASQSASAYERFSKLWEATYAANRRGADVSIAYDDLLNHFEPTARRMFDAVGAQAVDVASLARFVVRPARRHVHQSTAALVAARGRVLVDRALRRYASFYARHRWPNAE
jgi:hypothetical protein